MQTIALGSSGRETTRLGFGCSSVMGSMGRTDSLAMLEAAYDAGIRHFDVAPTYGFGEAEGCLGEFMARHKGEVTVTTKFGIPPEQANSLKAAVRGLARPVLKLLPGLKKKLRGNMPPVNAPALQLEFSVDRAKASLDHSLAALRVERVDVWLLHEASAADLTDDRLLRFMEDAVAGGKIGAFGVGSDAHKMPALLAQRPGYCRILQYEWSVLDPPVPPGEGFRMHHRALTDNFTALHQALLTDSARAKRWSDYCGADVSDAETLARLMLKASLVCNPESVILFSSKRPRHIANNVKLVDDTSLEDASLKLYSLVRAEANDAAGEAA
jgi:aryl-alcohol dehydrogenase-like predicted oxidoreductase